MDGSVRTASDEDLVAILNVLDGAALETDHDRVRERILADDVLVAVPDDDPDRILGACVIDGIEIVAIAVRRRRRDQGIGSMLIAEASRGRDRLVAEFDATRAPFYDAVGFASYPIGDGRLVGIADSTAVRRY